MSAPLRRTWTQAQFFAWAAGEPARYEFDGEQPVAMTGGTVNHGLITQNLHAALRARLRGGPCRALGPDVGVATTGEAVRYPDALITCSKLDGRALLVDGAVVLFEVLSANSGRTDRIIKVREYAAIPSVRRYVILESTSAGLMVLDRQAAGGPWQAGALTGGSDVLRLPEIGIEIPVAAFYEDVEFTGDAAARSP